MHFFHSQVAPAELEALLCAHPSIQDAAVIGLKADENVGEVPKAFVVVKPEHKMDEKDILQFVESMFFRQCQSPPSSHKTLILSSVCISVYKYLHEQNLLGFGRLSFLSLNSLV